VMATLDINGKPLRKGSKVRRAKWGSDVIPKSRRKHLAIRTVLAVGKRDIHQGCVLVADGIIACWSGAEQWERI